ncbi:MAG: hypothetical protein QOE33_1111 [Acidobacteriota bacterium]|nr:hypothetical protein [Acidobacteriota bacterium]
MKRARTKAGLSESSKSRTESSTKSLESFKSRLASLKSRRADACALVVIIVFFALFFGWLLLPEGAYPVSGDSYFYSYPLRTDAWRMIRAGHLPLWTPHVMAGYPLLSMAQLAIGYPLTWGHLVLPGYVAETIYILAPFLLAPSFTYIYARQIGRSRAASLLSALAYGWGGGIANGLAHSGMLTNAVTWLPLFLVAIERAHTRPLINCLIGATAAYTMCVLNGHAQGFVYTGALALCYAAFVSLFDTRARVAWDRWRPLAVGAGAVAFSAGLCAFQIMETLRAARRSVRSVISYETFAEGSFPPAQLFESMALPLFSKSDVSAYVAPLALAFALAGAWLALRRNDSRRSDPRPAFWSCVVVASFLLMIGDTTPFYRLAYYAPVINRFRVPARHSFELTFAIAALAAYGFDLIAARLAAHRRERDANSHAQNFRRFAALASVAICAGVGFGWHHVALSGPATPDGWSALTERQFAVWKIVFSVLTLAAAWLCLNVVNAPRSRAVLLACALAVALFFEPFICYSLWWRYVRKDAARFSTPAAATRFMLSHAPDENRVYTRVNLFADETIIPTRVDGPDLAAARGLREVAGYEPLAFVRYTRALADAYPDVNDARSGPPPDTSIFGARSHVLDLLNTTYVAVLPDASDPLVKTLPRATTESLTTMTVADQTTTVAGQATTADASATQSAASSGPDRWGPVYDREGLLIVRNRRACPRAWLVAEAEAVDGEQALRRIRGGGLDFDPRRTALLEDAPDELPQLPGGELASGSDARVVAYEPSRVVVETNAQTPTLLVVSEMFYPGWEATVDGRAERIHLADFLLRAVPLPSGAHRIEMRYRAPQARNGLIVSVATLLMLACLALFARRR